MSIIIKYNLKKLIIFGIIITLLVPISAALIYYPNYGSQARSSRNTVVGPIELLNNGDFATDTYWSYENGTESFNSTWDASNQRGNISRALPDPPKWLDETNIWDKAFINQTFTKSIATRKHNEAVKLSFDYRVRNFDASLSGTATIIGYVKAYIDEGTNPIPVFSQTVTNHNTIPWTKAAANVGNLMDATGPYTLSIQFQININCPLDLVRLDLCQVLFDNVSVEITDRYPPVVQVNQQYFGPYNSDPGSVIDVDFLYGGGGNNTLDLGAYKIGPGGTWTYIFTSDMDEYTTNWAIVDWSKINEGSNIIYLLSNDTIGNSNDTEYIEIFQDTQKPSSYVNPLLPQFHNTAIFNVSYTQNDPPPSGGINYTELWYRINKTGNYIKFTDLTHPNGNFTDLPINFVSSGEGIYEFYTVVEDNATNRETSPAPANADASTSLDLTAPNSSAGPLALFQSTKTFDVPFTANDGFSGIDYIELYYSEDNGQTWNKYQAGGGPKYTSSPISFQAAEEKKYWFYTVAYDNATNMEIGGLPASSTTPDVNTTIDTKTPTPIILTPINYTHITGNEYYIIATSDLDTEYIEFDFYNDTNNNTIDDDSNNWVYLGKDNNSIDGWNITWNINNMNSPYVLIRAKATDFSGKIGEVKKVGIEVDNTPPAIAITSPSENKSFADTCEIKYTTAADTILIIFEYYNEGSWYLIKNIEYPGASGSYLWIFGEETKVDLRATAFDEVGLSSFDLVKNINFGSNEPTILPSINSLEWTWDEDFKPPYVRPFSNYEYDVEDSGDKLKWYTTGHNESLYDLSGNNRTDDTFTFTSILDKFGEETITFHLWDSDGLEATKSVLVKINPINDAPAFSKEMTSSISVKFGVPFIWDLSTYIEDVDNPDDELTLTTSDPSYISINGLELTIQYPVDMLGQTVTVDITIKDPDSEADERQLQIKISDNFPPEKLKTLPDLEFQEGETIEYIDLDLYFIDKDGDLLTYTATYAANTEKLIVTIDDDGTVDFSAQDWEGKESITFTATDPYEAFAESVMEVTVIGVNDPPVIEGVPDISVRFKTFVKFPLNDYIDDDNDTIELQLWVSQELKENVQIDHENNLGLILWFPRAENMPYQVPVIVWVSDGEFSDYDKFIVTVTEFYPITQIQIIDDIEFDEDTNYTDELNLWNYFEDLDGGSHFEVSGYNPEHLTVETIDTGDSVFVNFYPAKDYYGYEKIIIAGIDTKPISRVNDTIMVYVRPINDPPVISSYIPEISVDINEPTQFNFEQYLSDVDDAIYNLTVTTDDESIEIFGRVLTFNFSEPGKKIITITIDDGEARVSREITVIVKENNIPTLIDQLSNFWWFFLIIIIVVMILVSLAYIRASKYSVEEMFLVHKSGILIAHRMRKSSTDYDEEIVSGMFTAVQEFIKDTFSSRTDSEDDFSLQELTLGENKILLERGEHVYLALIFSGRGSKKLRAKTEKLLKNIEIIYSKPLRNWVGDMDKFKGIDGMLRTLIPKDEALSEEKDQSKKGVDMLGHQPQSPSTPPPFTPSPQQTTHPPQRSVPTPSTTTTHPPPRAAAAAASRTPPTPVKTPNIARRPPLRTSSKPTPSVIPKQPTIAQPPKVPKVVGRPTQPRLPPVKK